MDVSSSSGELILTEDVANNDEVVIGSTLDVQVEVSDDANPPLTVSVTLEIADRNGNSPPEFPVAPELTVLEHAAVGTTINEDACGFGVTDPDQEDDHFFEWGALQGDSNSASLTTFELSTDGCLRLLTSLDFETSPSYTLAIAVRDRSPSGDAAEAAIGMTASAVVTISVADQNDAPVASDTNIMASEATSIETELGCADATDADDDVLS